MICNRCNEEHEKTKWKSNDPNNTWCEKCLSDGDEEPYIQYTMIEGEP